MKFQRLLLSLSHRRTLTYVDVLGEDFDGEIRVWKGNVEGVLESAMVCFFRTCIP